MRLGVVPEHVAPMSLAEMVPAPGQGCLAVQARASDGETIEAVSVLDHPASRTALEAERGLMARLGGGCALPLGAFAEPTSRGVRMVAIALTPDGARFAHRGRRRHPRRGGGARRARPVGRRRGRDPRARPPVKPLAGRTVLVTRPRPEADELARRLERRGATAIVAPAIELAPVRSAALTRALRELAEGAFSWVTLTSPRTVDVLAEHLTPRQLRANVAAVGEGTAEAFRGWSGREADLVPKAFTTEALGRAFPRGNGRVLTPRADVAPEGLEDALVRKGWTPTRVDAYRTRMPRSLPAEARTALRSGAVDAVTFTSASTVRGFVRALGVVKGNPRVVCIGPVTAREAREHGLSVHAVANPHTIDGLVAAVERVLAPR